ncbi:baeRF7 domain-containing protein [Arundinibacter roseus]|uniref:Uncharacterized protein n=1 Tax=Arundinibacter roseus TaxID=2070510 RepID=A0A4R4KIM6_9BACT|nr:hypothetical protein [Arundinibacter roseus]TDB68067.1 hypothetical protein EZE20_03865 [Arundinibacter roseus]
MEIFRLDQFNDLLEMEGEQKVSIFSPTSRSSSDNYQQDKINFKNQLKEALTQLMEKYEWKEEESKTFLAPGYELLEDVAFWQHSSDAVAFFHSSAGTIIKQLPFELDAPSSFVGKNFMLKPLVPLLNANSRFYILNLNQNDVRLYEAGMHSYSEVVFPEDVPATIDDYLVYVHRQESLQFRSGGSSGGNGGAMFHGHGAANTDKIDIEQYFYELSKKVEEIIACEPLPVVLAGVEYLIPIYRKTADYNGYVEGYVQGSFAEGDAASLYEKALEVMEPIFEKKQQDAQDRFKELQFGEWASFEPEKVILAALTGQVDTLFVRKQEAIWGHYNESLYTLTLEEESTAENKDLLTEACVKTILQNGQVYMCAREDMPEEGAVVAAIFRNPVTI